MARNSKTFLLIFISLIFIELIIGFISLSFGGVIPNNPVIGFIAKFFNYLVLLSSLPLSLYDKSYPYYAMVSTPITFGLIILNLVLQTIIIKFLFFRKK